MMILLLLLFSTPAAAQDNGFNELRNDVARCEHVFKREGYELARKVQVSQLEILSIVPPPQKRRERAEFDTLLLKLNVELDQTERMIAKEDELLTKLEIEIVRKQPDAPMLPLTYDDCVTVIYTLIEDALAPKNT